MDQRTREIYEDLARDRAAIGETVELLAQKADVGARVKGAVSDGVDAARRRPGPWALAAVVVAAVLLYAIVRRR